MDTVRRPFPDAFCRAPPCNPATPFEKGVDPKTFLRMGNILFMERHRIRYAGAVVFRVPVYGYRAPSPLWCFVLSCMVGGILRKPLGFRRCLPPARPEKAKPFQAGRSPFTKHPQTVRLGLYTPKKFLRVPRGVFSKTLLGRGWDGVPQKERASQPSGCAFSGGRKSLHETPRIFRLRLYKPKKFLRVPRGVFQKRSLGREWDSVPQREKAKTPTEKTEGRF